MMAATSRFKPLARWRWYFETYLISTATFKVMQKAARRRYLGAPSASVTSGNVFSRALRPRYWRLPVGCGIFVPVEVRFKWPTLCHTKMPFSGVFGTKGSIGTRCSALLPGINRRPNLCPPGTGPTRLHQEVWLQSRRGPEGNRLRGKAGARRTQEVLALAQARKVDVILVTELRFVTSAGMGSKPTYLVRWWLR